MQYPPVRGAGRATDETERREANGHGGKDLPSAPGALQTQPPRYVLVACRNLRSCLNVTLFGVDLLASHSRKFFWILTFFPTAAPMPAQAARGVNWQLLRSQRQGSSLRIASVVKIVQIYTELPISVGAQTGLWGKILEGCQRRGLKQPEQMAEFHHHLQCVLTVCFSVSKGLSSSAKQILSESSSPADWPQGKDFNLNAQPRTTESFRQARTFEIIKSNYPPKLQLINLVLDDSSVF